MMEVRKIVSFDIFHPHNEKNIQSFVVFRYNGKTYCAVGIVSDKLGTFSRTFICDFQSGVSVKTLYVRFTEFQIAVLKDIQKLVISGSRLRRILGITYRIDDPTPPYSYDLTSPKMYEDKSIREKGLNCGYTVRICPCGNGLLAGVRPASYGETNCDKLSIFDCNENVETREVLNIAFSDLETKGDIIEVFHCGQGIIFVQIDFYPKEEKISDHDEEDFSCESEDIMYTKICVIDTTTDQFEKIVFKIDDGDFVKNSYVHFDENTFNSDRKRVFVTLHSSPIEIFLLEFDVAEISKGQSERRDLKVNKRIECVTTDRESVIRKKRKVRVNEYQFLKLIRWKSRSKECSFLCHNQGRKGKRIGIWTNENNKNSFDEIQVKKSVKVKTVTVDRCLDASSFCHVLEKETDEHDVNKKELFFIAFLTLKESNSKPYFCKYEYCVIDEDDIDMEERVQYLVHEIILVGMTDGNRKLGFSNDYVVLKYVNAQKVLFIPKFLLSIG